MSQTEPDAPGKLPAPRDAPESPWRTLAAREVYRNPWLFVTEYAVIRPDGQPGIYGVVDPGPNATIVALDGEERVWLLREFSYPLQRTRWTLPGGRVEEGEDPLVAAARELEEEAGLRAASWTPLGEYALSGGISNQVSSIYLARDLESVGHHREGTERMEQALVPLRAADAMCRSGEIFDAVCVIGLWRAWALLHGDGLKDSLTRNVTPQG